MPAPLKSYFIKNLRFSNNNTFLPTYLPTYLLYLPTSLPTQLPTYLSTPKWPKVCTCIARYIFFQVRFPMQCSLMFLFSFPRDHVPVKLAAKRAAVSMSSASSSEASLSFPLSLSTASSSDASGKLTISQFLESVLHVVQLPRQARATSVSVRSAPSSKGMKSKKDKKTRSRPSNTLRFSLEDAVAAEPFL